MVHHILFEAGSVENVRLITLQLYDALLILKSLHADSTVEPLLEHKGAKGHWSELLESIWPPYAASIKATYIAKGYQGCKDVNGESKQEQNATDS